MPVKVILTDEAFRQIELIGDYIARDSPELALQWVERFFVFADTLAVYPQKHEIAFTLEQTGREVRQALFGVYRVLYEAKPDAVYVLTVRHSARKAIGPDELRESD